MKNSNKKLILGIAFVIGIMFLSFVLTASSRINPQLTSPGTSIGFLGRQNVQAFPDFNPEEQCQAGQDFVIQIAPFGCTPAVVRSDLLEEQNVPVFCQLMATKINPLIDVEAIDFITFRGDYPEGVQGVGFHPAKAAIRGAGDILLNSPVLQNIGYAVIVLNRQPNESSMPDFVSGNLTASIRYDIKNAFGIGKATHYLPEFSDELWSENFNQYSFWNGRAFLRADTVTESGATISIYTDENNKLTSANLEPGQISNNIYLPGFSCLAGLQLRLDDIENPDTRVKFNINGEVVQVSSGESFLENKCSLATPVKQGLVQKAEVTCRTDDGGERFQLILSPKITLSVDGVEDEYGVGDKIYESGNGAFYLGYVDSKGNNNDLENLFVYVVSSTEIKNELDEDDITSTALLAEQLETVDRGTLTRVTGVKSADAVLGIVETYVGFANLLKNYLGDDRGLSYLEFGEEKTIGEKSVQIINFASPVDEDFENEQSKANFENAMEDYRTIIDNFADEREEGSIDTFGQRALIKAAETASKTGQKRTLVELCKEFSEKYPDDKAAVEGFCENNYKLSNEGITQHSVFINGRVKEIKFEGISEPSKEEFSAEIAVRDKKGNKIEMPSHLRKNQRTYLNRSGTEYIELVSLTQDSAEIRVRVKPETGAEKALDPFISDTKTLELDLTEGFGSNYVFTLTDINLKKVARVSVLPNVKDAGTETNFSFNIGIEKRAVQLSPDKTKDLIDRLNRSIGKWEDASQQLDGVVRGFNAACLAVGTTLTVKNLIGDVDGRAIARKEVMRSDGGWYDICRKENPGDIDACLVQHSDEIERDVSLVEDVITNQEGVTDENLNNKLPQIANDLAGNTYTDPETGESIQVNEGTDVYDALSRDGFDEGKITLTQARDIERLNSVLNSNPGPELKKIAETKLYRILKDVDINSEHFAERNNVIDRLGISREQISFVEIGKDAEALPYSELRYEEIQGSQISDSSSPINIPEADSNTLVAVIQTSLGGKYIALLDDTGGDRLPIKRDESVPLIYNENGNLVPEADLPSEIRRNIYFQKFDRTTYENRFKDPRVRYFETEPYKGLPAIVPFDRQKGWYVATKQTLPGFGAARSSSIRAYDDSGAVNSFYLCNVGRNGREEFNSPGNRDDICRSFSPSLGVRGEFPGLSQSETNRLVSRAVGAIDDASRQYGPGVSGNIRVLNENIPVGEPSVGLPDIQCQDVMSPEDCSLLFNTCDPVVCPSSRCDFGGSYPVADVVQSGIIGSSLLCLPNFGNPAEGGVAVPICLSGVKAGVDSFVSVQENYRDCLQRNLETGETVGICDEIHSVYMCDFFWSQALPISQIIVPKALEYATGQTGRGGGEYLGVQSAWRNAEDSVDYMTNYYGAASFEAFRTGVVKEVGNAVCKNFISAAYPEIDFVDSVLEPESPPQFTGWFSERSFSTATVPPTSQYKVFYHIFAGENDDAYYSVYLKNPSGTSFFATNPTLQIANGYIPAGDFASETRDLTSPSGYRELCINVNGQEECGFDRVSTDFSLNYLNDQYLQEQAGQTDIRTENECISGTPSLYSLANPNIQAGVEEIVNPSLYREQIVRVCSTDNPGQGTDPRAGTVEGRWVQVGTCDEGRGNLKCYVDTQSVETAIQGIGIQNETLSKLGNDTLARLREEGNFLVMENELEKLKKMNARQKIDYIDSDLLNKALLNSERARLLLERGNAYAEIVIEQIRDVFDKKTGIEKVPEGGEEREGTSNVDVSDIGSRTYTLDSAISELERIEREYGNIYYSNTRNDGTGNLFAPLKELVDRLNLQNPQLITDIELDEINGACLFGKNEDDLCIGQNNLGNPAEENAEYVKELLERKKLDAEREESSGENVRELTNTIASINLQQVDNKVILETKHDCYAATYEIKRDRTFWFDKSVSQSQTSGEFTIEFDVAETESDTSLEIGNKYYAESICSNINGQVTDKKTSDILEITSF